MVITVPRFGTACLAAKVLFDGLRIPYVIPEKLNNETIKAGCLVSPEEICLPFKAMMGSILECSEKGADTVLITGSCGPCRFGEYPELSQKLLKSLKKDVGMIVIDSPSAIGARELLRRIRALTGQSGRSGFAKVRALADSLRALSLADGIAAGARIAAGYEIEKGAAKKLLRECEKEVFRLTEGAAVIKALKSCRRKIRAIKTDPSKDPVKIALAGEIYSMIEPFANLYIEEKLMDRGVCSKRLITPGWWLKDLALKPLGLNSLKIKRACGKYLPSRVGGHAKETVAHAVISRKEGFDGVIQIYPLGCMPEIIAKSVLSAVQEEEGMPVLSLAIDEMTGEAGYETRIDAFLDMLEAKKKRGAGF